MSLDKVDKVDKQKIKNQLFLLEYFIKELKEKYLPEVQKIDYRKLVQNVQDVKVNDDSALSNSFSKSINTLTEGIMKTTQVKGNHIKAFSMLEPIKIFEPTITAYKVNSRDFGRKKSNELIKFSDGITRPIRLIQLDSLALDNMDVLDNNPNSKRKSFFGKKRSRG